MHKKFGMHSAVGRFATTTICTWLQTRCCWQTCSRISERFTTLHYYSAPGLSWDALLKKTGVELELLTDMDMHLFIEREVRGGVSMVSKRYRKANNPRVEGYEPAQPTNYITYLDANNLYGWAMSLHLPKKGFHWKRVMPTAEQIMKMKWSSQKGWILEVDLEYPEELHYAHNDYPLAPEKKEVKLNQMSEYQRRLMVDLDLTMPNTEKLALTLEDRRVRGPLQEPAVLSQTGNATEQSAPSDRV